jgi:RNA polymerase sigma-70 factor (ECF subfamily)
MNQQRASDTDLIGEVLAGNTRSYAILLERYQHMVYTLAVRMLGTPELAEETTQDIFVKAYESLSSFRGDSKFSTWLYRVAYRKILDALAREKRNSGHMVSTAPESILGQGTETTWLQVSSREKREILLRVLERLSVEENAVLSLFYLQEQSLKEIGALMDVSPSTVKVRLFRAREKLKGMLEGSPTGKLLKTYE